jgi:hypothetical protein
LSVAVAFTRPAQPAHYLHSDDDNVEDWGGLGRDRSFGSG